MYEGRWLGMTVAVKVAREGYSQGSKAGHAKALVAEVEVLRTLRHPCICSYIGVVMRHDGVPALVCVAIAIAQPFLGRPSLVAYCQP